MGKKSRKKEDTKNNENKRNLIAKMPKTKSEEKGVRCDICNKSYSKKSNLNAHIAVMHKGRRFICMICEEDQTTKASYVRHMKRKHPDHPIDDVQEKEFYATDKIQMTEAAKDALLERLSKELAKKNKIISKQKKIIEQLKEEVKQMKLEKQSSVHE